MPTALVIGSPIDHSLSPVLHRAGYEALGLTDWQYDRREVVADEVPAFLASLEPDVVGCSVTMPCKEAALAVADAASDLAREVGSANTLIRRDGGWFAENTDVAGIVGALRDAGITMIPGAVVIGSGATARSVVAALAQMGAMEITFVVRHEARPETVKLAEDYGMDVAVVPESHQHTASILGFAPLIISTVPAGAADYVARELRDAPSLNIGAVAAGVVMDVVYANWPTQLAQVAGDRGARIVSGLDMLVHQAAVQFEMFTGHEAPIADMMRAGRAEMTG